MKRLAGILALVLAVSLLGVSHVRAGFGGGLTGKTKSPSLTTTIVADLTGGAGTSGKGLTAIRVQKAGTIAAVLFTSTTINQSNVSCQDVLAERQLNPPFDRFLGLMDKWVTPRSVRVALLGNYGDPDKGAIVDTDRATCTSVDTDGDGVLDREILSLDAVIQFQE